MAQCEGEFGVAILAQHAFARLDADRWVAGHAEVQGGLADDACVRVARAVKNDTRRQTHGVIHGWFQGRSDGDAVAAEHHIAAAHIDFDGGGAIGDHNLAVAGLDGFVEVQHHGAAAVTCSVVAWGAAGQGGRCDIDDDAAGARCAGVASNVGSHGIDGGAAVGGQFVGVEAGGPDTLCVGLDGFGGTVADRDRYAGVGFCCAADGDACGFLCGVDFVVISNQTDGGLGGDGVKGDGTLASLAGVACQVGGHCADGAAAVCWQLGSSEAGAPGALGISGGGFGHAVADLDRHVSVGFGGTTDAEASGFFCGVDGVVNRHSANGRLSRGGVDCDLTRAGLAGVACQIGGYRADGGFAVCRQLGSGEAGAPSTFVVGFDCFGLAVADLDRHVGVGFGGATDADASGFLGGVDNVVTRYSRDRRLGADGFEGDVACDGLAGSASKVSGYRADGTFAVGRQFVAGEGGAPFTGVCRDGFDLAFTDLHCYAGTVFGGTSDGDARRFFGTIDDVVGSLVVEDARRADQGIDLQAGGAGRNACQP